MAVPYRITDCISIANLQEFYKGSTNMDFSHISTKRGFHCHNKDFAKDLEGNSPMSSSVIQNKTYKMSVKNSG